MRFILSNHLAAFFLDVETRRSSTWEQDCYAAVLMPQHGETVSRAFQHPDGPCASNCKVGEELSILDLRLAFWDGS